MAHAETQLLNACLVVLGVLTSQDDSLHPDSPARLAHGVVPQKAVAHSIHAAAVGGGACAGVSSARFCDRLANLLRLLAVWTHQRQLGSAGCMRQGFGLLTMTEVEVEKLSAVCSCDLRLSWQSASSSAMLISRSIRVKPLSRDLVDHSLNGLFESGCLTHHEHLVVPEAAVDGLHSFEVLQVAFEGLLSLTGLISLI